MMQGPVSVGTLTARTRRAPIVLYSCMYGKREAPNPDTFGASRGSYPCFVFSDDPDLPVADGVTLVHDPLDGLDPIRASRRSKLMPERYLPPCEWSVYLDNKMQLAVDAGQLVDRLKTVEGRSLFVSRHPLRDCLYDEGVACVHLKKESVEAIHAQLQHYETLGFPRNAGLIQAMFLVRRHGDDLLRRFGERWFEHVLRYSRRDQISFPFVARRLGIMTCDLEDIFDGIELFRPLNSKPSPRKHTPPEPVRTVPPSPTRKRAFWQNFGKRDLS